MSDKTRRIREELARQVDDKNREIQLAESLGKGNPTEVRTLKFQAEQWQEVLDKAADQDESSR